MGKTFVVNKPWGKFEQFALNEQTTVKILTLNPKGILSKQSHEKREELWVMLDDGLKVELDQKVLQPKKGEKIFIPKKVKHRLSSEKGGRVLEISFGEFDEEDITRHEDVYGRV
ncbi:phosphomannose isomerase type II C-terminal cupin domain [Candidatus Woesearchaeota archaeon]|nr:phosphomannose isomerase type II C-terminal cupin domain [Candidatus Woesearchaeota archaeon]